MKKMYMAMKFKRDKSKLTLEDQLENDLRSQILEDKSLIVTPTYPLIPDTNIIYNGPFYCESAGDSGDVTCTDCQAIVYEELKALDSSDIFLCYLDDNFSTGSIVELMYCTNKGISTYIIYKQRQTKYDIKSEYWFAIVAAKQLNPNVEIISIEEDLTYDVLKGILKSIDKGEI